MSINLKLQAETTPKLHHEDFLIGGKTAIYRKTVTAPLKCVLAHGLISSPSSILHYAKGKAQPDSDALSKLGQLADYDYCHEPNPLALGHHHDFVVANYCLNVLPYESRQFVINQIANCTRRIAFISVRTDKIIGVPEGDGVRMRGSGTFQRSYGRGELVAELREHFEHVCELKLLKGQSGFSVAACSHDPLPPEVYAAAKT